MSTETLALIKYKIMAAVVETGPLPKPAADSARLQTFLSVTFLITGSIALLVITIAGFRYTISHGDPRLIAQSKNAILYAVVGLVVSISAFAIVNFVIGNV
ncbi:MAG TPA: hypothetical protein VLA92_04930 [Candidatus Saccharimonadales bacterium]|nr:hypothetical protein [Candidatus Saccharimonadales bacterium]